MIAHRALVLNLHPKSSRAPRIPTLGASSERRPCEAAKGGRYRDTHHDRYEVVRFDPDGLFRPRHGDFKVEERVIVLSAPVADFTATPRSGTAPLTVTFPTFRPRHGDFKVEGRAIELSVEADPDDPASEELGEGPEERTDGESGVG